jgi:hypothetical protein
MRKGRAKVNVATVVDEFQNPFDSFPFQPYKIIVDMPFHKNDSAQY